MSFLEALKIFLSNIQVIDSERIILPDGSPSPDKIIFHTVNQLLENFKLFKKIKNPNFPDIRFENLGDYTYEKLLKEGFKSVCLNAKDDKDAKERISYLISQYYDQQYLHANPKIQQLNDDVKEILKQYADYFPQVGSAKLTHHKIITLPDDFDIESFKDYTFSKNEPRKSRLKNLFFTIHEVLQTQQGKSLPYSGLIAELKTRLGIFDYEEIHFPEEKDKDETTNDDNIIEVLRRDYITNINDKLSLDENNNNPDEEINDSFVEEELVEDDVSVAEDSDELSKNYDENMYGDNVADNELNLLAIKSENLEIEDSVKLVNALNRFINLCTVRQRFIFGFYLLKEDAVLNEDIASEIEDKENYKELKNFFNEKFKGLTKSFKISMATLYYEKDRALEKLELVFHQHDLDKQQKQAIVKNLISYFEDYLRKNGN